MHRISDSEGNKTKQIHGLAKGHVRTGRGQNQGLQAELFKQFSEILDQIASQLAEEQELSAATPPRAEPVAKREAPEEAKLAPQTVAPESKSSADGAEKTEETPVDEDGAVEDGAAEDGAEAAPEESSSEEQVTGEAAAADSQSATASAAAPLVSQPAAPKVEVSVSDADADAAPEEESADQPAQEQSAQPEMECGVQELAKEVKPEVSGKQAATGSTANPTQTAASKDAPQADDIQQLLEKKASEASGATGQAAANRVEGENKNINPQKPVDPGVFANLDAARSDTRNAVRDLVLQSMLQHPKQVLEGVVAKNGAATNALNVLQGLTSGDPALYKQAGNSARSESSEAKALPKLLAHRTLEKVESALKEVARSKDGKTISVRLDPPELGSVKIDVSFRDGNLHARIVAESSQVNGLLREKSHELQNLLRRIGIDASQVSVSIGSEGSFGQQSQLGHGDSSHHSGRRQGFADMLGAGDAGALDGAKSVSADNLDHWVA